MDLIPADNRNGCDDCELPGFLNWKVSAVVCALTILGAVELVRWVV